MALESFVFIIAEKVLEKLASNAYNEICAAWGFEEELKKLGDILSTIKAVLLDAEEKQLNNHQLQIWLGELKDALYDAEDVLDDYECEIKTREVLTLYGTTAKKVARFLSSSNPLAFSFKMANKVKKIRKRLDDIASHKAKFHLKEQYESRHIVHRTREMTHSYVEVSDIIGRDDDKENIIQLLMNPTDDRKITVIPIVGIAGMGKTTLTKLVRSDERIKGGFEIKMWVIAPQDFDKKTIIERMIKSATNGKELGVKIENLKNLEMDPLQRKLQDIIGEKKYLLVLDDVWNEDPMKWNELKELLCMGGNGSKILVTTRSNQVASVVGNVHTAYELLGLSHDECVDLFTKFAFKEGQDHYYPNLLKLRDEIVRKCKGVPLAVKTLASLLFTRTDEDYWKSIRDNELWKLDQKENDILPALRLSYEQLPSHLKRCFAYCSLYPKDYEFYDIELIQLWMAHGLIQSSNEDEELEDVGIQYVQELASRSFFQDLKDTGISFGFKMHDLMHDLALSLTQNELAFLTSRTKRISKSVRHLLVPDIDAFPQQLFTVLQGLDKVRTVLLTNDEEQDLDEWMDINFSRFQVLRVLDLSALQSNVPLERIGSLKHLRMFHFHGNSKINKIPNSICKLQNLQSLLLCEGIEEIPTEIRYLISLRHLCITTNQKRLSNKGIGCLKSLRYLIIRDCENLEYLFEDLQNLNHLRLLIIVRCESLISLPQGMNKLVALKTLFIMDCETLDLTMEEKDKDGDELISTFSLKKLKLEELPKLVNFPDWLLQGSNNTLQFLGIADCNNLKELPAYLQNMESLQELRIQECGKLGERCESEKGEDWYKIAHIPKRIIE